MRTSSILATVGAAGFLAAGGLAAAAVSQSSAPEPTKTVTIDIPTGTTGPPGPPGPKGDTGPAGPAGLECLDGYNPGILIINSPSGHANIYTCLEGP